MMPKMLSTYICFFSVLEIGCEAVLIGNEKSLTGSVIRK